MKPKKYLTMACLSCEGTGLEQVANPQWLQYVRKKSGLALKQISQQVGLSVSHICSIELGNKGCADWILKFYEKLEKKTVSGVAE